MALMILLSANHNAAPMRVMEPVFGIEYDPAKVHFEKAPLLIGNVCADMRGKDLQVYARLKEGNALYFIAMEHGAEFGVAIIIRGNRCGEVDSDRFLYEGPRSFSDQGFDITKDDNRKIMNDMAASILAEYSKVFGGKKEFLDALGANANMPDSPLRTQLKEFRESQR